MFKFLMILVMLFMVTTNLNSQTFSDNNKFVIPKQSILGAEESVPPGDVVILKISQIKDKPPHLKEIQYHWTVFKNGKKFERFIPWPDNSVLVFGSGNDTNADIKVLLSIGYRYEVVEEQKDKDGKVTGKTIKESAMKLADPIVVQVKIGEGPVNPDVPPDNPVNPDPVFPAGRYNLSKISYDAAKKVTLNNADKVKTAKALANNYKGIASAVNAGTIKTPVDMLKKTAEGNTVALGNKSDAWQAWDEVMEATLIKLNKTDKTMITIKDFADAWIEISEGLSQVK